jgi:putative peptidoglycan lipid II flippase
MLQALQRFAVPALLRIVSPAVSIIAIIALVQRIGIYALAVGVVAGSFIQLALLLIALKRQGFSYRFIFKPFDPTIKKLIYLTYPFLLSVLATQGAGITYRILVSDLPSGSLASIKFAEKITQLLTIIFLNSVTMVIYPVLSTKAAKHDMIGIRDTIGSSIRLIFFVTVPVITVVALLRQPLISFIYQRGSFSASDVAMTSLALLFLVIGLTTNGISSVLGHATLALQETRAAVAVSIASQAVAVALFVLLVPYLAHAGLALASSLVPLAIALLYFLYLTRFIPHLIEIFYHPTYTKTLSLSIVTGVLIFMIRPLSFLSILSQPAPLLLQIFLPAIIGGIFFFTGAYLWRIPELLQLLSIMRFRWLKVTSAFSRLR